MSDENRNLATKLVFGFVPVDLKYLKEDCFSKHRAYTCLCILFFILIYTLTLIPPISATELYSFVNVDTMFLLSIFNL